MALIKAKQIESLPGSQWAFTPKEVPAGTPITVPENQQWVLYSDTLNVLDDLTLEGDVVIML